MASPIFASFLMHSRETADKRNIFLCNQRMRHIFSFGSFWSSFQSQQRSHWVVWYFFFFMLILSHCRETFLFIAHSIFKSIYLSEWLSFCFDAKPKVSWESECVCIEKWIELSSAYAACIRAVSRLKVTVAHNRENCFPNPFVWTVKNDHFFCVSLTLRCFQLNYLLRLLCINVLVDRKCCNSLQKMQKRLSFMVATVFCFGFTKSFSCWICDEWICCKVPRKTT